MKSKNDFKINDKVFCIKSPKGSDIVVGKYYLIHKLYREIGMIGINNTYICDITRFIKDPTKLEIALYGG